jgi:hypothetical protein
MKKIILGALVFGSLSSYAQTGLQLKQSTPSLETNHIKNLPSKERFKTADKKVRAASGYYRWLDYMAAEAQIAAADIDANTGLYNMFPDSVVRFNPPNNAFGIAYKSLGQVIDPASDIVHNNLQANEMFIGKTDAYTIDSIFILGSYVKTNAAVDTMIVSFVHSTGANLPEFFFTGQQADFSVDTTRFLAQLYPRTTFNSGVFQNNATGGPASYIVKYPLTNMDSSDYVSGSNSYSLKFLGISANAYQVPAGEKASVSVTFKPGSPYAAGDSIGKHSRFLFMSCEPNGGANGSFMPFYEKDRNMSHTVHKDSTNWGGLYIPTLAWTVGYGPEVHDFIWKISCATCFPLNTNNISNVLTSNVYPNPAQNQLFFDLKLKEAAKNLSISITNTVGQVVKTQNFESVNKAAGLKMDVSDLANGVYIYSIKADGTVYSNKFSISK